LQVFFLGLLFLGLFVGCNQEPKGFTSEDFSKMTNKSMSKTMEKALKDPSAISSLNLSDKGLEEAPKELDQRFTNLIQLILKDNKIKELPKTIGLIPKLISIHVGKNELTTIPASIGGLNKMANFTAEMNQIKELPDVAFKFDKFGSMDLRWNKLETLPQSFANSTFSRLMLTGNQLKGLPDNFGNLKGLKELNIANCPIEKLPDSFYELKNLKRLDIRGTKLSKKQMETIQKELPNCSIMSDFK